MKKKIVVLFVVLAMMITVISSFMIVTATESENPGLDIAYCNLSFRDNVCIKYAVKSSVSNVKILIWTSPEANYTIGTQDTEITKYYNDEIDGSSYMIFDYTELAAKQMTDVIYARVYSQINGVDYYSEVNKYSILQYAYNMLGKTNVATADAELKELLVYMLEYGASAQKYLDDYKVDRLATADWYQVKLNGGLLDDGCTHGLYLPGDKVTMTAPVTDANGATFSYWADSKNNKVATTATYELTVGNENEVYTPVYESVKESFTVTFLDYDGTTVLKTETVNSGEDATAPANPTRNGYTFIGWDKTFNEIAESITVTAQYEIVENQTCINYTDNGDGTTTAKFSINGDVNIAMIELQLSFDLTNATYKEYEILVAGSADAIYSEGVFYFSFMSANDITTDTELFSITFTTGAGDVGIAFTVVDSYVSDGTFTNITTVTIVGTTYNG